MSGDVKLYLLWELIKKKKKSFRIHYSSACKMHKLVLITNNWWRQCRVKKKLPPGAFKIPFSTPLPTNQKKIIIIILNEEILNCRSLRNNYIVFLFISSARLRNSTPFNFMHFPLILIENKILSTLVFQSTVIRESNLTTTTSIFRMFKTQFLQILFF